MEFQQETRCQLDPSHFSSEKTINHNMTNSPKDTKNFKVQVNMEKKILKKNY